MNDMDSPRIDMPVRLQTNDFRETEAIVVECPECFAMIRAFRLAAHLEKVHDNA